MPMHDIFNVHVGRAVSFLAENDWSPDSRKALHFTRYDQLQWEYEDEDLQPCTEFLPSLAIKCAAEAWPHPSLLLLRVWILIFLCFPLSLYNQSTHIHMHTLLSQHLYLWNPITNPRINNETQNSKLLRAGLCFLYCATSANNQLLTQVMPLKASSSYMCGKKTHSDPNTTFDIHTLPGILALPSAPTYLSVRVGQTVTRSLPSVLEEFNLKTLSNWDAATFKQKRFERALSTVSCNACFN